MDFVIVGGGILGLNLACDLVRLGAEVLVVEAESVAGGASGGEGVRGIMGNGAGMHYLSLLETALPHWPALVEEHHLEDLYAAPGSIVVFDHVDQADAAAVQARIQQSFGIPTELLAASEVKELVPSVSPTIFGGLYCSGDGYMAPSGATHAWARRSIQLGVHLREQCRIVDVEVREGRVRSIQTEQGERIPIQIGLVLCANAGTPELVESATGVKLPVWPAPPQLLFAWPIPPEALAMPVGVLHSALRIFPSRQGRLTINGGRLGLRHPVTGTPAPSELATRIDWEEACALVPSLRKAAQRSTYVSRWESYSLDGLPIIDRLPGVYNGFMASGWCGKGWAIAPAVSSLLSEWFFHGDRPQKLLPFSLGRFPERIWQATPTE